MRATGILKQIRVAVRSGIVWGVGWAAGGFLVFQALLALGAVPGHLFWGDGLMVSARLGPIGGLVGAAFSLFIGVWYRGRRLSEIDWRRFALAGGLLAGVYVPAFLVSMKLLSGDGFSLRYILDDALLAGLFGTVMAGGSMKLAQRAEAGPEGAEGRAIGQTHDATLPAAGASPGHGQKRSRAEERVR
jgi:hypothetical protein